MKATILTSFVAIALASTTTLANVIPLSNRDTVNLDVIPHPPIRRLAVEPSSEQISPSLLSSPQKILPISPEVLDRRENRKNSDDIRDIQHLNFALVIEEFLTAFFERGLARYTQEDFMRAGHAEWVRGRYLQLVEQDRTHKEFLQSAITSGRSEYVRPCKYEFTDNDVHTFVEISEALETITASAYTGSLQYYSNKAYVTTGASILAVKSRHASWINSAVRKQSPGSTAFETLLTPNEVATLLSDFVNFDSCPSSNRDLLPPNFHTYPKLSLSPRLVPGEKAEISFPSTTLEQGERIYVAFLSGIETIFVPLEARSASHEGGPGNHNEEGSQRYFVEIPRDLAVRGTVFVTLVKGRENIRAVRMDEESIVAGPAMAMFPSDANGNSIGY